MLAGYEQQRPDTIEQQAEHDSFPVAEPVDEKPGRNGHNEIAHIHGGLNQRRVSLGYFQQFLEMLVQHVKNRMSESPQKEQGSQQYKRQQVLPVDKGCPLVFHVRTHYNK